MDANFTNKLYESYVPLIDDQTNSIPIIISDNEEYLSGLLSQAEITYVRSLEFFHSKTNIVFLSGEKGNFKLIILKPSSKTRFLIGERIASLPAGSYKIESHLTSQSAFEVTLGFCLSSYKYQDFRKKKEVFGVKLCIPKNVNTDKIKAFARAEFFARNLINTPASHLGPNNLEKVIKFFAKERGATFKTIVGDELLNQNFPMIHAVGRAGFESPRFVVLEWGSPNSYKVTLVGKGVCFDTGGLNIKSGSSMGTMKKDMGGAASVLGLADCIMSSDLNVSLKVLIPIIENSISAASFRPGDVLKSRKGITVEVNNTDAEGRLILADALSYADDEKPDLLICMATLTGAARVALGPDIAPFYTDDEAFSKTLIECSLLACDPVWRLPFYAEYEYMIEPAIADLDNAPKSGMAGSITAALFLKKFVEKSGTFVHLDVFAWSPNTKPARPIGGLMQGVRALYTALENRLSEKKII
jgi:leucyl aminopeptidase